MRIALGSDHRGYDLKQELASALKAEGYECQDFGACSTGSVDYPDFAEAVANAVASGECQRGILVCGTGIGMSIAANKVRGIRAALCHNVFYAQRARQHNDANIVCLGAEQLDVPQALAIAKAFLETDFEGGRHQKRLDKVSRLEAGPASVAEAKAKYAVTPQPAREGSSGDEAIEFLRTASHKKVRRSPDVVRRIEAILDEIEAEARRAGDEGPTDVSENLDKYTPHF